MTTTNRIVALGIAALLCAAGATQSSADQNAAAPQTPTSHRDELIQRRASSDGIKLSTNIVSHARQSAGTESATPRATSITGGGSGVIDSRPGGAAMPGQRQEFLKKYDNNGDGRLDSSELAAFRA